VSLRPAVLAELDRHGLRPADGESPASLRDRLNDLYLEDVRALRARQVGGEIALREYAGHVQALKERYPLLGLPLSAWVVVDSQ
jgi:hypothetical protein